jgi:hypothetical protein
VHCVGYGEIVWYMLLNVLCVTVSLSVCVVVRSDVLLVQYCVRVCVCVCVSGVWTVHCVGYGEIVWYMQLNVLCVTVSLSVCVVG